MIISSVQLFMTLVPFLCASISLIRSSSSLLLGKEGNKRIEILFSPIRQLCSTSSSMGKGLRDARTRGSPPGSRDRRTAAWSLHSPGHSDRRMTCVAAGTVLYSLKCSHLHNLQGLWSEPAISYSPSLHLKERQVVRETAWPRAHLMRQLPGDRTNKERKSGDVSLNPLLHFGTVNQHYISWSLLAMGISSYQRRIICISPLIWVLGKPLFVSKWEAGWGSLGFLPNWQAAG